MKLGMMIILMLGTFVKNEVTLKLNYINIS